MPPGHQVGSHTQPPSPRRTSLQLAEQERDGGLSPRVSPMADPRDASNLLQRAGFTLLTVDVEDLQVSYPSIWELMEDLRDMGESGAVLGRRPFVKRDTLIAADAIYKGVWWQGSGVCVVRWFGLTWAARRAARQRGRHGAGHVPGHLPGEPAASVGEVRAFSPEPMQIGWKPSATQPKALPRGSGKTNLKDVLG